MKKAKKEENQAEILENEQVENSGQQDELQKQLTELSDKFLRMAAEYENFRKRTTKEKEQLFGDAVIFVLSAFLPVYDNLERALANESADKALQDGVRLVYKQMCEIFEKLNIKELDGVGTPFNPEFHEATTHVDDPNFGANEVCEVYVKGFKCGDKILRHSMVRVAN